MKAIEPSHENLKQIMYGLLLPAVCGTIFWYLVQHIVSGRFLSVLTCAILVYYFGLHFLAGLQVPASNYRLTGFLLDLVIILAIESLFYAISGLPEHLELGMISVIVILLTLFVWNIKSQARRPLGRAAAGMLGAGILLTAGFWFFSYRLDVLTEHYAVLCSVIILGGVSSCYLQLNPRLFGREGT